MNQTVVFKGTQYGLELVIQQEAQFESVVNEMSEKFLETVSFFKDAGVEICFTGKKITNPQRAILENKVLEILGDSTKVLFKDQPSKPADISKPGIMLSALENPESRFFKGTIRSGQRVASHGDLIVIGDVNPGGEALASGNVVVLGRLRGLAHAGLNGNKDGFIAALLMSPTQIRIANIFTYAPSRDKLPKNHPEIAYVKDGEVFVERLIN